jgi:dihydropteroate synthase type 1
VRVLSPVDLEKQIGADGATWLDRRLIHGETADLASAGFGQQVREAMDQRREHHIEQGDASRSRDGRIFYRRNLLATLREREVASARRGDGREQGAAVPRRTDGENVSGKFTGTVQLPAASSPSSRRAHEFTLVPWRPVIDRQLGREVMGVVQGGSVSWQLGRQRG